MDLNMVVICGRVAGPPDVQVSENGGSRLRLLVTVRSDHPRRRIDVIPVTWWNPPDDCRHSWDPGTRVWVTGSVERRFSDEREGRRSRLEIVALAVNALSTPKEEPAP